MAKKMTAFEGPASLSPVPAAPAVSAVASGPSAAELKLQAIQARCQAILDGFGVKASDDPEEALKQVLWHR